MAVITSKLTERSQTTVPPAIRKVLGLHPGDQMGYVIKGDEVMLVNPAKTTHEDPTVEHFLFLLQRDIAENTRHVRSFPTELIARARALTSNVVIDHDAHINGEIEF